MQNEAFIKGEGNAWFHRNAAALAQASPSNDPCFKLLVVHDVHPIRVLEVGASNGYRLSWLDAPVRVAVDVSGEAVADGARRYPQVSYVQGSVDAVPLRQVFDLVIVNFVLHWVDRERLDQAVDEIDRVLVTGGFLVLGDFHPTRPMVVPYHHKEGLSTFKENYARRFVPLGYRAVAGLMGSHDSSDDGDGSDRTGTFLMRKVGM